MKRGSSPVLLVNFEDICYLVGTYGDDKGNFFVDEVWWSEPNPRKGDFVRNWPEMIDMKPIVPFDLPTRPSWVKDFLHFVWPRKISVGLWMLKNPQRLPLVPPSKFELLQRRFGKLLEFQRRIVTTAMRTNPKGNFYTFAGKNCYVGLKGHCWVTDHLEILPSNLHKNDSTLCPDKGAVIYWKQAYPESSDPDFWFVPSEELDVFLLFLNGEKSEADVLEVCEKNSLIEKFLTDAGTETEMRIQFEIKP